MLMAGVHPKVVSEMLGHSSVSFTLDTYSHVIPTLQQAAMKRLDEVLQPELRQGQDVSKMFATESEPDTASGRIRTDDRRFTKCCHFNNSTISFKEMVNDEIRLAV